MVILLYPRCKKNVFVWTLPSESLDIGIHGNGIHCNGIDTIRINIYSLFYWITIFKQTLNKSLSVAVYDDDMLPVSLSTATPWGILDKYKQNNIFIYISIEC